MCLFCTLFIILYTLFASCQAFSSIKINFLLDKPEIRCIIGQYTPHPGNLRTVVGLPPNTSVSCPSLRPKTGKNLATLHNNMVPTPHGPSNPLKYIYIFIGVGTSDNFQLSYVINTRAAPRNTPKITPNNSVSLYQAKIQGSYAGYSCGYTRG